ncbi:MAG: hypothetical protein DI533_14245 [Cereibacter sphaeroides]|uniref:Polysaccharide pyruvyl transferase domain-containing protein n=1 Tax=Cereibacter sphaeroides TaxID=1063 RepID=A0A2W5SBY5_CERSP|nr:MAG: hypothetical protein DI533_14245 [Cereibacter sphaeroides]
MADPVIEISGVWLPNKGAELMAHTVVAELGKRLPGARFASTPQGPQEARDAIGMTGIVERDRKLQPKGLERYLPFGRKRVSHVIDISGFAYGDFWGVKKARDRAGAHIRAGRPTYLLPQAFGPFKDDELAQEMRHILQGARYFAARDLVSQAHLDALKAGKPIPLLPDITMSLNISDRQVKTPAEPFGCLVLNAKTIEAGAATEDELMSLYTRVAQTMRDAGAQPVIVLHEPVGDRPMSERLAKAAGGLPIVDLPDARDIKAFIARARIVVTGRFHGLVNGLAGGVPSFAVSWSHKYGELLSDFGRPDASYKGDADDFIRRIAEELAAPDGAQAEKTRLAAVAAEKKAALGALWDHLAKDITRG